MRYVAICAGAVLAAVALQGTSAQALTSKECSAKYKEAKQGGTLNGMKWNDFRKAQCGADASGTGSCRRIGSCRCAGPDRGQEKAGARARPRAGSERQHRLSERGVVEIFKRFRRQGALAHLPRSVRSQ
jgi:hypothetical protein